MCKENIFGENLPLEENAAAAENDAEYEVVVENINSIGGHTIRRNFLVDYIQSLGDSTTNESFISPSIAMKIIDFVHVLNHRTGVPNDTAYNLVREWYKVPVSGEKVIPFNQRTKTMEEIMNHLEKDCNLNNVLKN